MHGNCSYSLRISELWGRRERSLLENFRNYVVHNNERSGFDLDNWPSSASSEGQREDARDRLKLLWGTSWGTIKSQTLAALAESKECANES